MKFRYLFLFAAAYQTASAQLMPLGRHIDFRLNYVGDEWQADIEIDGSADVVGLDEAYLPISDNEQNFSDPSDSGGRLTQPSSSAFAFIGAEPGDPIWVAAQNDPGVGEAFLGWRNRQDEVVFGSYLLDDPRLSGSSARPWIRVQLIDYVPPVGKTGHFSLWNSEAGRPPTVWMSTADTSQDDSFYYAAAGHTHTWWGFTSQGVHRVKVAASAFLADNEQEPTGVSDPFVITFTVGDIGRWQATYFEGDDLEDAAIVGLAADPDGDGHSNLVEYAFGTHPDATGTMAVEDGLGMPEMSLTEDDGVDYITLRYPRRLARNKVDPDVYIPEFTEDLTTEFSADGFEIFTEPFTGNQSALNQNWEMVTARRAIAEGEMKGFARVRIIPGDGFAETLSE